MIEDKCCAQIWWIEHVKGHMTWDRYVVSIVKRLGEDYFFSGAFVFFQHISAIFRAFCLVVFGNFVYLHTVKGVDTISHPL